MTKVICNTLELMAEAEAWCAVSDLLAVDVETIPHITRAKKPQPFVMTVISYTGIIGSEIRSYAFQLTTQKSALLPEHPLAQHALLTCGRINANDVRKCLQNGIYDCAWFCRYGIPLANYAYDSMTLWWAQYPDLPKTLDFISSVLLDSHRYWKMGRKEEDFTNHTFYAMGDTETTLLCTIKLLEWASRDPLMLFNFHRAHLRNLTCLSMSLKGMEVDETMFAAMGEELSKKAAEKLNQLRWLIADEEFNPNSVPAKKHLFHDLLGAQKRNAKGRELKRIGGNAKVSLGAIVLRSMKSEHPILRRIVDALQAAQEPAKQISNVVGMEFHSKGSQPRRFTTGYDGVGTTTERLSSRKDAFGFGGNGQNIRKKFRRFAKAERGKIILEADFSAADDIFVSYESEESRKIEIIEQGYDTHCYNVAYVFFTNWAYERVLAGKKESSPDYELVTHPITGVRQIVKKLTHGCNYLMAGHTLLNSAGREAIVAAAKQLGHLDSGTWGVNLLVEFCEWLDGRYRAYYPRFARAGSGSFYADLSLGLRRHHSFTTIFGYTQRFLGDPMADSTLRACAATVGQANTAGRVNMAMMELDQGIRMLRFRDGPAPDADEPALPVNERDFGCSLRLQTHDSLSFVIDVEHPRWAEGVDRIFRVMNRPVVARGRTFKIGVEADIAVNLAHHVETVHKAGDIVPIITQWANADSTMAQHFNELRGLVRN